MASDKAVHKARLAVAFRKEREERSSYRVLEITPTYVLFFFSGYKIRYEYHQGHIVRNGEDYTYVQAEDYAFMFKEAEMLMKANVRGLNSSKEKTKQKKVAITQIQPLLPFLFSGQESTNGSHS
jgi:hypothetical protein